MIIQEAVDFEHSAASIGRRIRMNQYSSAEAAAMQADYEARFGVNRHDAVIHMLEDRRHNVDLCEP